MTVYSDAVSLCHFAFELKATPSVELNFCTSGEVLNSLELHGCCSKTIWNFSKVFSGWSAMWKLRSCPRFGDCLSLYCQELVWWVTLCYAEVWGRIEGRCRADCLVRQFRVWRLPWSRELFTSLGVGWGRINVRRFVNHLDEMFYYQWKEKRASKFLIVASNLEI